MNESKATGAGTDQEKRSILSWISQSDVETKHSEILSKRLPGTVEWFLQESAFEEWISGHGGSSILWCPGFPGVGKTTITSVVIDHLFQMDLGHNTALAYIYCDKNGSNETALEYLSSICRQLASQKPQLPDQLLKLHKQMTQEGERPGIDDIMLILLSLCDSFSTVYICVDALDECEPNGERPILISKLQWMRNHSARIFITSRMYNKDIAEAFDRETKIDLRCANAQDLENCLMQQLKEYGDIQQLLTKGDCTVDTLIKQAFQDAGGMFSLARLILEKEVGRLCLEAGQTATTGENTISEKLESFEIAHDEQRVRVEWRRGLGIIQRQAPWERDLALRVLSWVVHAKEPLQISGLMQALLVETGHKFQIGLLVNICEGLVAVREINGDYHLFKDWVGNPSPEELNELFPNAQLQIATTCVEFLSWDSVIASDHEDTSNHQEIEMKWPFKRYARRHWSTHVLACNNKGPDTLVCDYLCKIHTNPARLVLKQVAWSGKESSIVRVDDETPIIKAVRLGLDRVLALLLFMNQYDIDAESWRRETAMSVAVCAGNTRTVQRLYRYGASLHYRNAYGHTLLHEAAENDDDIMVALLVSYGLDLNIASLGHYSETPLHMAVSKSNMRSAKMLLDLGADPFAKVRGDNAMRVATRNGWLAFIRLLVDRGFDLAAPTISGDTLLYTATESGSLELVEYMIANSADIFESNDRKRFAIHCAARNGHLGIVKVLLKHGADPFVKDDGPNEVCDGRSAMEEAIYEGHQDVVDLLLPRVGKDIRGETILGMITAAIREYSPETARVLLENFPRDLAVVSHYSQLVLLLAAVEHGDEKTVTILLDRGLSTSLQHTDGWNALHEAAACGSKFTQVLLKRGADPNLTTSFGLTPVHIAAHEGQLEVLSFLLNSGPDLSIRAEDGSTALIAAAYGTKPEAVRLLLHYGAPVSDFNTDGESALHHAIIDSDVDLVRDLLKHGIDPSIQSRRGGSALHLAAFKGYAEIVDELLDQGADIELCYDFCGDGYEPRRALETERAVKPYPLCGLPWNQEGVEIIARPRYWSYVEKQWTVLHSAVCGGHVPIVRKILQHGGKISSRGIQGETPLHVAASAGQAEIIKLLLDHGASVSDVTNNGETALHSAALAAAATVADKAHKHGKCNYQLEKEEAEALADNSKPECIAMLLDYGADPTSENGSSLTPLALAAASGHQDIVEFLTSRVPSTLYPSTAYVRLLEACAKDSKAKILETVSASFTESNESLLAWGEILSNACLSGDHELVSLALRKGAVLTRRTADGINPFHHAIENEKVEIVNSLLGAHADLMARDARGRNALHIAASHEGEESLLVHPGSTRKATIASSLVQNSAPINFRTPEGNTALHFAVSTGDHSLVRTLLQFDASVNIRNKRGLSPLHTAVNTWVFPNVVKMLLERGACPNVQDYAGFTPLHHIRTWEKEGKSAADLLLEYGADCMIRARNGDRAIHCATRRSRWDLVKRLLEAGASVHDEGEKGRTVLHVAAKHGRVELINPLIKLGSDVNALDCDGWTPLHYAVHGRHLEVVSGLLKYHARLSASKLKAGTAPFTQATQQGDKSLVKLLVEAGIDVDSGESTVRL